MPPLHARFIQDSPVYPALHIFATVFGVGLVILGLLYVLYAGTHRPNTASRFINHHNHNNDNHNTPTTLNYAETGAVNPDTQGDGRHGHRSVHSVDTLPRYEPPMPHESREEQQQHDHELGQVNEEEEEPKPPPYTFDAAGPFDAAAGAAVVRSAGEGQETAASHGVVIIVTPPPRAHLGRESA